MNEDVAQNTCFRILCFVDNASWHNSGKWPTWCIILFSCMFISILYMFRATSCSLSGESIVSVKHLVYVTLPDLHTRQPPIQSDIYQTLYWYDSPDDEHEVARNM
jgi:hypothetical protein